ncbi:uncharacterized protein LOC105211622 [Zeugodacus cucurbitae]|uniref:uncharacterized protein LOC105211622 n=1 Tax=Zeugodacus cucurbitae TaxID=28588 RepID=UPI0023D95C83|nr:uncharacterized protein LOC105211622 [Zeugodacus cucurbitae]
MKFVTNSVVFLVLLFGVCQASVIPAMKSEDGNVSACQQKYQPLLTEFSTLKEEATQHMVDCFHGGNKMSCLKSYAPIFAAINTRIEVVDAKINYCLKTGVDKEPTPSARFNTATSSTTGGDGPLDCKKTYKLQLAYFMSMDKNATNQMIDCMFEGNTQSVCSEKFVHIKNEINSGILAINKELSICLKEASVVSF